MADFFSSIFSKKPTYVNIYQDTVTPPYTFDQLSFSQLEQLYDSLAYVRIVEDFISDNIAKIGVGVYDTNDEELFNTPLNQIIDEANPTQSWAELVKEIFILYGLTGNIFTYRAPDTGYLYTMPTSKLFIILGKDKILPEFYNYIAGYRLDLGGKSYPLLEPDVFHLKTASLSAENGLWALGSSPYFAGSPNIETIEATLSSRIGTIRDRGALGFISNDSDIPDEEQSKLVQEKLQDYGVTKDKEKVIVTTEKLRWQQMSLGIAELQFLENLKYDFDTICQLRGLDPIIFSSEGSTYANQLQARKGAINNVLIPIADKFYTKFNEWIRPYYGGMRILPKYDELPEYGELNTDLSKKIIEEYKAGLLNKEQAFTILYPDLEFIEDEEPEENTDTDNENSNLKNQNNV